MALQNTADLFKLAHSFREWEQDDEYHCVLNITMRDGNTMTFGGKGDSPHSARRFATFKAQCERTFQANALVFGEDNTDSDDGEGSAVGKDYGPEERSVVVDPTPMQFMEEGSDPLAHVSASHGQRQSPSQQGDGFQDSYDEEAPFSTLQVSLNSPSPIDNQTSRAGMEVVDTSNVENKNKMSNSLSMRKVDKGRVDNQKRKVKLDAAFLDSSGDSSSDVELVGVISSPAKRQNTTAKNNDEKSIVSSEQHHSIQGEEISIQFSKGITSSDSNDPEPGVSLPGELNCLVEPPSISHAKTLPYRNGSFLSPPPSTEIPHRSPLIGYDSDESDDSSPPPLHPTSAINFLSAASTSSSSSSEVMTGRIPPNRRNRQDNSRYGRSTSFGHGSRQQSHPDGRPHHVRASGGSHHQTMNHPIQPFQGPPGIYHHVDPRHFNPYPPHMPPYGAMSHHPAPFMPYAIPPGAMHFEEQYNHHITQAARNAAIKDLEFKYGDRGAFPNDVSPTNLANVGRGESWPTRAPSGKRSRSMSDTEGFRKRRASGSSSGGENESSSSAAEGNGNHTTPVAGVGTSDEDDGEDHVSVLHTFISQNKCSTTPKYSFAREGRDGLWVCTVRVNCGNLDKSKGSVASDGANDPKSSIKGIGKASNQKRAKHVASKNLVAQLIQLREKTSTQETPGEETANAPSAVPSAVGKQDDPSGTINWLYQHKSLAKQPDCRVEEAEGGSWKCSLGITLWAEGSETGTEREMKDVWVSYTGSTKKQAKKFAAYKALDLLKEYKVKYVEKFAATKSFEEAMASEQLSTEEVEPDAEAMKHVVKLSDDEDEVVPQQEYQVVEKRFLLPKGYELTIARTREDCKKWVKRHAEGLTDIGFFIDGHCEETDCEETRQGSGDDDAKNTVISFSTADAGLVVAKSECEDPASLPLYDMCGFWLPKAVRWLLHNADIIKHGAEFDDWMMLLHDHGLRAQSLHDLSVSSFGVISWNGNSGGIILQPMGGLVRIWLQQEIDGKSYWTDLKDIPEGLDGEAKDMLCNAGLQAHGSWLVRKEVTQAGLRKRTQRFGPATEFCELSRRLLYKHD